MFVPKKPHKNYKNRGEYKIVRAKMPTTTKKDNGRHDSELRICENDQISVAFMVMVRQSTLNYFPPRFIWMCSKAWAKLRSLMIVLAPRISWLF